MRDRTRTIVALVAVTLLLAACSSKNNASTGTPSASKSTSSTIAVDLQEWSVVPSQNSVAAGSVTFNLNNKGPKHQHEFVVVKTDLDLSALPLNPDGSLNEDGQGLTAIGEEEDIAVGATPSKTFTLTPGKYIFFCNILEQQATPDMLGNKSHFKLGMRTTFTVT